MNADLSWIRDPVGRVHTRIARNAAFVQAIEREWARERAQERRDREQTAVHEAGHAVVSVALGRSLGMVSANRILCRALDEVAGRDPQTAGFTMPAQPHTGRKAMAIAAAGRLAEQAAGYEASWYGEGFVADRALMRSLAARKGWGEWYAIARAEELARPIVERYGRQIAAIARALLTESFLGERDIRKLMGVSTWAA